MIPNLIRFHHLLFMLPLLTVSNTTITSVCYCGKHDVVDCSYRNLTQIPFIPSNFFFKTLNFNGNYLEELSAEVLRYVPYNISYMYFKDCEIKSIKNDTFQRFAQDLGIRVGYNNLDKPSIENLFHSYNLASLDASGNDFGQYGRILNISLSSEVQTLILTDCNISFIDSIIKTETQMKLENLDLRGNKITEETLHVLVQYGEFYNHLEYIDVSFNPLGTLSMNTFSMLKSFRRLFLRNISFKSEPFYFQGINCSTLRYLDLSGSLTLDEPLNFTQIFRFLPELFIINLSKSNFTKVTNANVFEMLSPLKNLESLEIGDSLLSFVPHNTLRSLRKLKVVDLSGNQITGWPDNGFTNMSSQLKKLYLYRNKITMVTRTSFPSELLNRLEKLYLYGNPFSCVCSLHWFRDWMRDSDNYRKLDALNPTRNASYECYYPVELNNTLLVDFDPNYEMCGLSTILLVGGIVISVLFVSTIGLILMKKYCVHKTRKGYDKIDVDHSTTK